MKIGENCAAQFTAIFATFAISSNLGQFHAILGNFFGVLIGDNLINRNFAKSAVSLEIQRKLRQIL